MPRQAIFEPLPQLHVSARLFREGDERCLCVKDVPLADSVAEFTPVVLKRFQLPRDSVVTIHGVGADGFQFHMNDKVLRDLDTRTETIVVKVRVGVVVPH